MASSNMVSDSRLCDVFEMLVERISNIEDQLRQQNRIFDILKHRDHIAPAGSKLSGLLHCDKPLEFMKCYENAQLADPYNFDLVIENLSESSLFFIEESDIVRFHQNPQAVTTKLQSIMTLLRDIILGPVIFDKIAEACSKQAANGCRNPVQCKDIQGFTHYTHDHIIHELNSMYIIHHYPYITFISGHSLIIDLQMLVETLNNNPGNVNPVIPDGNGIKATLTRIIQAVAAVLDLTNVSPVTDEPIRIYATPRTCFHLVAAMMMCDREWFRCAWEVLDRLTQKNIIAHIKDSMNEDSDNDDDGMHHPDDVTNFFHESRLYWTHLFRNGRFVAW